MSAARRRRENFEILRLENTILHSFLSILQQKTYPSKVKILKIFGLRPKKWLNSPLVFQSDLTRGEFIQGGGIYSTISVDVITDILRILDAFRILKNLLETSFE